MERRFPIKAIVQVTLVLTFVLLVPLGALFYRSLRSGGRPRPLPTIGMTRAEVQAALGPPDARLPRQPEVGQWEEEWHYSRGASSVLRVHFTTDGKVTIFYTDFSTDSSSALAR